MRNLTKLVVCGVLALSLVVVAGCAKAEQPDGNWHASTEAAAVVSADEQAIFEEALEGLVGVDYEPIAVLATQLVSGTNRAYLCKGTTVTANPTTEWYVVVVYQNLDGEAQLLSIQKIDVAAPKKSDEGLPGGLMGGWSVVEADGAELVPAEAGEAYVAALEGYVGVDLNPIAVLGVQVKDGTNYLVLCSGAPVTLDPASDLYLVEVHANSDGTAEVAGVSNFDLLGYVTE